MNDIKLAAMKIEDADKLYQYLITRPYKEVSNLIDILKNMTAVDDPRAAKKAAEEVKDEHKSESKAPKSKRSAPDAQPQN